MCCVSCGSSLVVIPSLRALSTLLCKTRPLLGFHQGLVTFHSNGSHLVVRLHVSALPQETCAAGQGLGLQGSGSAHFPVPTALDFLVSGRARAGGSRLWVSSFCYLQME